MSALHLIRDGITTAAELLALLFIAPVGAASAAEPALLPAASQIAPADPGARTAAASALSEQRLHLVDAALEMRFLGLLADVRLVQTVRNDTAQAVDLGTHLPAADVSVDSLAVSRDGRSVDLLRAAGCGGGDDPHAGHVRASEDEAIAELMQLPPGRQATVTAWATAPLQPAGQAWQVPLPATVTPVRAQALLVAHPAASHMVVIPPADAAGVATVTVRPASGPSRSVSLGLVRAGVAYVVPVSGADMLAHLAKDGAIELEVVGDRNVFWTTLAVTQRQPGPATLARAAE